MKKTVSGIMLTLLLTSMLTLAFDIQPATASLSVRNIDTGLDYATIQEAIDAPETLDGHKIFVDAGTYYEHVVVDKSLSLVGEDRSTTIIDGGGTRNVVDITANNVKITKLTVRNSGAEYPQSGIFLDRVTGCNVFGNNVSYNLGNGIFSRWADNSNISNNLVTFNGGHGIRVSALGNILVDNIANQNGVSGIFLYGASDCSIESNIALSNHRSGIDIQGGSRNIIVEGNKAEDNEHNGIFFYASDASIIKANRVSFNGFGYGFIAGGIVLHKFSDKNVVSENNLCNNRYGIALLENSNCQIYHNNFIDNSQQVHLSDVSNHIWDDGYPSGGNYWSDYEERYPDAEELDGSGIGDTPYVIDENNQDNYPLMSIWTAVTWKGWSRDGKEVMAATLIGDTITAKIGLSREAGDYKIEIKRDIIKWLDEVVESMEFYHEGGFHEYSLDFSPTIPTDDDLNWYNFGNTRGYYAQINKKASPIPGDWKKEWSMPEDYPPRLRAYRFPARAREIGYLDVYKSWGNPVWELVGSMLGALGCEVGIAMVGDIIGAALPNDPAIPMIAKAIVQWTKIAQEWMDEDPDWGDLCFDWNRFYHGLGGDPLGCESTYSDTPRDELLSELDTLYQENGYDPYDYAISKGFPATQASEFADYDHLDFVGTELGYMAFLTGKEKDACRADDTTLANWYQLRQIEFIEHLEWMKNLEGPPTTTPFYDAVCNTVAGMVECDIKYLNELSIESMLAVTALSPVNILVTDPLGSRVGYDPATDQVINEIPGAAYSGPYSEPQLILIPNPLNGDYIILLIGTATGDYSSTIELITLEGKISQTYTGETVEGAVYVYTVSIADEVTTTSPDPMAELEHLKAFFDGLSDDSFDQSIRRATHLKKALFNKIDEVILKVEAGDYTDAINKLFHDIRAKMDGDSTAEDWIIDPEMQTSLCIIIDHIISSIETLQQA